MLATSPERASAGDAFTVADSAWARGDHDAAFHGYRLALESHPRSVRAVFRMGLIESWRDHLDAALLLMQQAHALDPADVEIRLAQARVLGWMSRFDASIAIYDSLLVASPRSPEASLGRARTLAWAGRLALADSAYALASQQYPNDPAPILGRAEVAAWGGDQRVAERFYSRVLARDPDNAEALTGLARTHLSQGRNRQAQRELIRALGANPTHRPARSLQGEVDAALRPRCDATLAWSEDSDGNVGWSQSYASSLWLASGLTGFASIGALEASDPVRRSSRRHGELGMTLAYGSQQLTTAAGLRELRPEGLEARSIGSGRATLSQRFSRRLSAGVDWSHMPLDETALLMGRGLRLHAFGGSLDAGLPGRAELSASVGGASISDGNQRHHWVIGVDRAVSKRLRVGLLGRQLAHARRGQGYFSPDRFSMFEARLSREWERGRYAGRVSGGVGRQQPARSAPGQIEWHLEGRAGRRWSRSNQAFVFFGLSEGGWGSESGAYRARTLGASVRLGL